MLLVDDVPGERANFEHAFASKLTVAPSIDMLNDHLRRGLTWDLAFVDFNLSSSTSTGLTALLRLHHERPATKIVTYSQFTESGRTLYAAAARHWFNAAALMDKTKNDPATLVRYRESIYAGINPTPVMWQRRLQWAHLIDNLLADASWVRVWRALRDAAGDMSAVAEMLHIEAGSLRGFKDRATEAAIQFNEKFHDIPPPARTRNKKGILAAFAAEHRHFLTAPDLSTVMSPGTRRRRWPGADAGPSRSQRRLGPSTAQGASGSAAVRLGIEVLDGVAQRGPRHGGGVPVQKARGARPGRPACRPRAATSRPPCASGRAGRPAAARPARTRPRSPRLRGTAGRRPWRSAAPTSTSEPARRVERRPVPVLQVAADDRLALTSTRSQLFTYAVWSR